MKKGKLFGVGVGPGDKELITVKAIKILNNADIVFVPVMKNGDKAAFNIVEEYIKDKYIVECVMPMCRNLEKLESNYNLIADTIERELKKSKNVAFITLGDPTIYSTYIHIDSIISQRGYETEIIPAVTSFCAAAAKLNIPLCIRNEPLIIIPASNVKLKNYLNLNGNKVIMKAGSLVGDVIDILKKESMANKSYIIERCGMENEKIYNNIDKVEKNEEYFSIIIIKDN